MAKVGRPTKYREEYAEQVYKLCLLGATDEQIADFFGVTVQTIHNWTAEHPEFLEARKEGKEVADANVAEALYHRAIGYSHPEEKLFQYEGGVIRAETVKQYPPDTAAAFIWLKNRAGWRDKQELHIETSEASDEELLDAARQQANRIAALTASRNGSRNGNGTHD